MFLIIKISEISPRSAEISITSIQHQDGCTALSWNSQPGEFYTVYWTSNSLNQPIFWQVAAVNVPGEGTNTTWSDCGGMQGMSLQQSISGPNVEFLNSLTPEEPEIRRASLRAQGEAQLAVLVQMLQDAYETSLLRREQLESACSWTIHLCRHFQSPVEPTLNLIFDARQNFIAWRGRLCLAPWMDGAILWGAFRRA